MIDANCSQNLPNQDHDSPWKEILELRFAEFLALLFPQIQQEIDWTHPPEFLDKELQQITQDSSLGRRYADKLVRVRTKDKQRIFVLIHVEVQGESDQDFSLRMFVYNYRIFDKYKVDVVSLGVLADTSPCFRPSTYRRHRWGCKVEFEFPVIKLLDWMERWEELEQSDNVFSLVIMAQIKAKTSKTANELRAWKMHLVRLMYERGYVKDTILELFRIIDWMIRLPDGVEKEFWMEYSKFEEDKKMPYMTSIERFGMEKGMEKGSYSTLRTLVLNAKKRNLSDEIIAELTGLDISSVNRIWNNEPVDLPPQLFHPVDVSGTGQEAR
ncbi:hypothetical protein SAMN06295888_11763 [Desulfonatronum zhilinae]|nr:hypothetical protein SAMN06295888_11763 [Desulfonatronum zhilinae]